MPAFEIENQAGTGLNFFEVDKKALKIGLAMHLQGKENLRQVQSSSAQVCPPPLSIEQRCWTLTPPPPLHPIPTRLRLLPTRMPRVKACIAKNVHSFEER